MIINALRSPIPSEAEPNHRRWRPPPTLAVVLCLRWARQLARHDSGVQTGRMCGSAPGQKVCNFNLTKASGRELRSAPATAEANNWSRLCVTIVVTCCRLAAPVRRRFACTHPTGFPAMLQPLSSISPLPRRVFVDASRLRAPNYRSRNNQSPRTLHELARRFTAPNRGECSDEFPAFEFRKRPAYDCAYEQTSRSGGQNVIRANRLIIATFSSRLRQSDRIPTGGGG